MKCLPILIAIIALTLTTAVHALPQDQYDRIIDHVGTLQEEGRLSEAGTFVQEALETHGGNLTPEQERALKYEVERTRRIRGDYSVTEEELIEALEDSIKDFSIDEIRKWEEEGKLDFKIIDGEKLYVGPSRSNLFFRYPEIEARRIKPGGTGWERFLWAEYQRVKDEYTHAAQETVGRRDFRCKMTITVKPNIVEEGETIRCWMPYPQQFDAQANVELLGARGGLKWVNNPTYPMRSLYFEQQSKGSEPAVFEAEYTMSTYPRMSIVDEERVTELSSSEEASLRRFMDEQPPHIVFTDVIRQLAEEIAAGETNPYLRARKYYDWICENIKYSYAREYSTLRNISMYVCENKYGDCGQITLLFMALCRAGGIPARWQSGWTLYPVLTNLHDWCEIYIEPYGWIPVDANYGVFIYNDFKWLTDDEREELRDYYFGGLDSYRLVANRDHGYPHYPPKADFRSDDVDFQRGELEAGGRNIYFGSFRYNMDVEYLTPLPDYESLEERPTKDQAKPSDPGTLR